MSALRRRSLLASAVGADAMPALWSPDVGDGGTIFQDTRKPLLDWFRAMYWLVSQKNGASALGLQRVLGLGSYKTAWTWLHKFRRAMVRPGRDRLSGRVEVDETYLVRLGGGSARPTDGT